MSQLIDERDRILQAHRMNGPAFHLPWTSFRELFLTRVSNPQLMARTFLSYYDDDRGIHRRYSYAQFGDMVHRTAAYMNTHVKLTRGDRVATALFNHDQTVLIYFAAWTLGIAVVPINVEEPVEKTRYILEHSEAKVLFCWEQYAEELTSCAEDIPTLEQVVLVSEGVGAAPDRLRFSLDELSSTQPLSYQGRCEPSVGGCSPW